MIELTATETIRQYDPVTREYRTVTVPAEAGRPARANRRRRPGQAPKRGTPRVTAGLSDGAPLPSWWRDTAYAPAVGEAGWADMRRHVKPATMGTAHRKPVIFPGPSHGALLANVTGR